MADLNGSAKRPLDEELPDPKRTKIQPVESAEANIPPQVNNGDVKSEDAKGPEVENLAETKQKDLKVDGSEVNGAPPKIDDRDRVKGFAKIKPEYLIEKPGNPSSTDPDGDLGDDAAENRGEDREADGKKRKKQKGQNKDRKFGSWGDSIKLCNTRANAPEFSPVDCKFGDTCKMGHDLRKYLTAGKRQDMDTFNGQCPVWEVYGTCHAGWKCRFVGSHSKEVEHEDGKKELVLIEDPTKFKQTTSTDGASRTGVYNVIGSDLKYDLARRKMDLSKSDKYTKWMELEGKKMERFFHHQKDDTKEAREELRAQFTDPPFLPSEKRKIYFSAETPILGPLTTQGNMPFRRMCVEFGAQLTYSEMAISMPLLQGTNQEWSLLKAHESEISPPRAPLSVVKGYDHSRDLKFGAQIESNQIAPATRAAQAIAALLPYVRVIDLNCGCPIENIYQSGGGSGLLDAPSKLEKMIRGMNVVSGEIPITAKIRMGTKDSKPTAQKTIERLAFGGEQTRDRLGGPGCAAITLHGRSRQQRYTKDANWEYIAECAALIKSYNVKKDDLTDTVHEPDARTLANTNDGRMYFNGNGDCYSHVQYFNNIKESGVDSIMLARGALIKPWVFEEIEKGQYLDKSATERLGYVEKFARYGLEAWGSDEAGVGLTRRFLLEWLSFAHRYVPIGLLEHLPPSLQDRPPAYRGRSDLETLLASENYLDWIKISEMFLGPAHKDFTFVPKHKSNSYNNAEG